MIVRHASGTHPLNRLRNEMEQMFHGFFDDVPGFGLVGERTLPPLNVWEDEANLYAEAELPGVSMSDLEIFVSGDELTVKGERKAPTEEGAAWHRRERGAGTFSRAIRLPVEIDTEKVEASLADGVLLITLPKSPAARPRKIEVQAS